LCVALYPETEYKISVLATNSLGSSTATPDLLVTTDSLDFIVPTIQVDSEENIVTVYFNSSKFCVVIMVSIASYSVPG